MLKTRSLRANGLNFTVDEAGRGEDVALCLHGFPEGRFSWRSQLPVLAGVGWRAVAPDLRGYGESERPEDLSAYQLANLRADVQGMFESLNAKRRILIGHDWGGVIAWSVAMESAAPLDGLVILNAPHPAVFRRVLRSSWRQWLRSWYVGLFQIPLVPEFLLTAGGAHLVGQVFSAMAVNKSAFPPSLLARYRANALRPGAAKAMVDYYRANVRELSDQKASTPIIRVPTLMIWGEKDAALGLELTQGYSPLVETFDLRRLPNASHWVQQDAPEEVNREILAWMDRSGLVWLPPSLA